MLSPTVCAHVAYGQSESHVISLLPAILIMLCTCCMLDQVVCVADGHSDFLAACKTRSEGKLSLEHSDTDVSMCDAEGPYDVVILDMALSQLVLALMQVSISDPHLVTPPVSPYLDKQHLKPACNPARTWQGQGEYVIMHGYLLQAHGASVNTG